MTIWGHEYVRIEKDPIKREWRVFVHGDGGPLLCTVPWRDASRKFTDVERAQYPDYTAAVATCASNPRTCLTSEEESSLTDDSQDRKHSTAGSSAAESRDNGVGNNDDKRARSNVLYADFVHKRRR